MNTSILIGRTAELLRGDIDPAIVERYLPQIKAYAAKDDLKADDVIVRGMYVCNDLRDYYYSRFTKDALHEVAELLPGRPLMRNHDYKEDAVGRFFAANVTKRRGKEGMWVEALYYVPNDEPGQAIARRIDVGVLREGSLGWRCVGADCTECGAPILGRDCGHIPGEVYEYGFGEYEFSGITGVYEASLVFAGGQKGTSSFVPDSARSAMARELATRYEAGFATDWRELGLLKRGLASATPEHEERWVNLEPGLRFNIDAVHVSASTYEERKDAAGWVRDHDFRADRHEMEGGVHVFRQRRERPARGTTIQPVKLDEGVTAMVVREKKGKREDEPDSVEDMLAK